MYRLTRGRINRATYWLFLAILVAGVAAFIVVTGLPAPFALILMIALCTPRLHDVGRSGWWAGGVYIVYIVSELAAPTTVKGLVDLFMLVGIITIGVPGGRAGPNRYGPQPPPGVSFDQFKDDAGPQS